MRAVFLLAWQTIARTLRRPRNIVFFALFYGFPALIAWLLNALAAPADRVAAFSIFYGMVFPTVYLALPALLYGGGALTAELEERTITFLLLRPIPKWSIVLGKYLGVVLLLGTLTTLSFGAFFRIADLRAPPARELGGTEALLDEWEAARVGMSRRRYAWNERRRANERARDQVRAKIDAWRAENPGAAAIPPELEARLAEIEREENALRAEGRRLRRDRRGFTAIHERWEAGGTRTDSALRAAGILWLGAAAYAALFLFLGVAIKRHFIAGIIYAVLYQTIVMPLFQESRIKWTVVNYHVQTLMHNEVIAAPGGLARVYLGHESGDALFLLAVIAVGFAAAACAVFTRKEYVLS